MEWEEAKAKFSLAKLYYEFWVKLVEFYGPFRDRMCGQHKAQPTPPKWVGMYIIPKDILPEWVATIGYFKEFKLQSTLYEC